MLKYYNSQLSPNGRARGFTLLETLVGISILLVAVVAPMALLSKNISIGTYARNQVTATYLLQDAMEYVYHGARTNIENGFDWLNGFSDCKDAFGGSCAIDTAASTVAPDISPDSLRLYKNSDGTYGHDPTGTPTKFYRQVEMRQISSPDEEWAVTVKVRWDEAGVVKQLILTKNIDNWLAP